MKLKFYLNFSMYGCLGFLNLCFYVKLFVVLVISKGCEVSWD